MEHALTDYRVMPPSAETIVVQREMGGMAQMWREGEGWERNAYMHGVIVFA